MKHPVSFGINQIVIDLTSSESDIFPHGAAVCRTTRKGELGHAVECGKILSGKIILLVLFSKRYCYNYILERAEK